MTETTYEYKERLIEKLEKEIEEDTKEAKEEGIVYSETEYGKLKEKELQELEDTSGEELMKRRFKF